MKLYFVICNFEKFRTVNEITFNSVRLQAQNFGFEVSMAYISQSKFTTQEQLAQASKDYPNVSFYLYDNAKSENECIFDCLTKQSADRYFVCDARYLEREDVVNQMLDAASYYGVHFVRCDCSYRGVFEGLVKFFTKLNNRILNFVSSASFSPYVRNFVIFDDVVLSYMKRSPIRSARIRETNYLVNTMDEVIQVPADFKKAKHAKQNWLGVTAGGISLALAVWCFICIFIASTNFDTTSWLIVGTIAFGVIGFLLLLIGIAGVRTSFYKMFEKRSDCSPVVQFESVKHSLSKSKEAKEQNIANAIAKDYSVDLTEKTKTSKSKKASASKSKQSGAKAQNRAKTTKKTTQEGKTKQTKKASTTKSKGTKKSSE